MSIESVMPSNHCIQCHPLLLQSSIFPSLTVFSNESFQNNLFTYLKISSISPLTVYGYMYSLPLSCNLLPGRKSPLLWPPSCSHSPDQPFFISSSAAWFKKLSELDFFLCSQATLTPTFPSEVPASNLATSRTQGGSTNRVRQTWSGPFWRLVCWWESQGPLEHSGGHGQGYHTTDYLNRDNCKG